MASFALFTVTVTICGHTVGRYTNLLGPLVVATGIAPLLVSEKAIHYRWFVNRIPLAAEIAVVAVLFFVAAIVYRYLSSEFRVEAFFAARRALTPWVIWSSVALVIWIPSRYFLPYSAIGLLNAYFKYNLDEGFWGWPASVGISEPWHSIFTHFCPFLILGVWLESLPDITRDNAV